MKFVIAIAAVVTSAMFTVPTVTSVGEANAADVRLAVATAQAEALNVLA